MSKINIRDLIKSLNKDFDDYINLENFTNDALDEIWNFDRQNSIEIHKHFKCYFVFSWCCTDSSVGHRAYFLDDEFICLSFQPGRKYSQDFFFESEDAYNKIYSFLERFKTKQEPRFQAIEDHEYIEDFIAIQFVEQLIPQFHPRAKVVQTGKIIEIDYDKTFAKGRKYLDENVFDKSGIAI